MTVLDTLPCTICYGIYSLAYKLTKPQNNDTPLDRQVDNVQISHLMCNTPQTILYLQQLTAGTDWASEDLHIATWTIDKADWVVLRSSITKYSHQNNEDQRSFHLAKE